MNKILLILWLIAGVAVLSSDHIPHLSYFLVWITLLVKYLGDAIKESNYD